MDLISIINKEYKIITEFEWKKANFSFNSREGAFFVLDLNESIIGMITQDGEKNELAPVGVAAIDQINELECYLEEFPVWIVKDNKNKILGWFKYEDAYKIYSTKLQSKVNHLKKVLTALPCQLIVIDRKARISYVSNEFLTGRKLTYNQVVGKKIDDVLGEHSLKNMLNNKTKTKVKFADQNGSYIQSNVCESNSIIGAVQIFFSNNDLKQLSLSVDSYNDLEADLKAVFDSSFDVIYVSDGNGVTLKVSSACEELWGLKADTIIGKSVFELEESGIYTPSITRLVLETKEKVQAVQTTRTGRRLVVVGTPIKDIAGEIIRVINTSRDITEENRLELELKNIKMLMEGYKRELEQLRHKNISDNKFIFKSEAMHHVVGLASKVAEVDSTVLITGESGVGKEVLASYIHTNSRRSDKPFIKINCGAIPSALLESELFGYEKGAFTGAAKEGKLGIFELANKGTLFLDEIGEIPLSLQVKLLRVLQENELIRVGGTKPVKIDIRIIAATNKDLEQEMKKGNFREDLYYRLNVVPIHIPSLRKRKEDILPLTLFFLKQYNEKYHKNKTISHEVIESFQNYSWAGNIRELQNIIERLVVLTDSDHIDTSNLPSIFRRHNVGEAITINRIIPLKQAMSLVEKQLIAMAKEKYSTTTKIAEVLGVDQSTISRKINKMEP